MGYIGEKIEGTDSINDLMIYDHTQARGNTDVIIATKGVMRNIPEKQLLELYVEDGVPADEDLELDDIYRIDDRRDADGAFGL